MPSISPIPIIGHAIFMSHALKLPTTDGWEQPSGDPAAQQYPDALNEDPPSKIPIPTHFPVPFFQPQNPNRIHQDSCNEVGKKFQEFHDDMLDSVKFAVDMWRLTAYFNGLKIMAVVAIGQPGCLKGQELESFIKIAPSSVKYLAQANAKKYVDAVAAGVSKCFKDWQDQVMVPGLPWYPAFAAFPGPMAPPMPNVPVPLIACVSSKMTRIMVPSQMKDEMINALDSGIKQDDPDKQHEALFDAIATALALAFTMWLPSQQVMLVMGYGNIPTFAPPYVPVGPVMNGQNLPTPGVFLT